MRSIYKIRLRSAGLIGGLALVLGAAPVPAVVAPYYAHVDLLTRYNDPTDFSEIEAVQSERAGRLFREAGLLWFCENNPRCGVSIAPGARSAYGDITADPGPGILESRAGSFAYDAYGGYTRTYGYISQTFRVDSDGSLQAGDPVALDLDLLFEGSMDANSQSATAAALVTVNVDGPLLDYVDGFGAPLDYMPVTTFEDLVFSPDELNMMLGYVRFFDNAGRGPVNFSDSDTVMAAVGDMLIVESMVYLANTLGFSESVADSWTDFRGTLASDLTPTTPGAILTPVPLPGAAGLLAAGLPWLLLRRRRRPEVAR